MTKAEQKPRLVISQQLFALLFCFLSGGVATLAFAPFNYWPLAFVSIIAWLSQINQQSIKLVCQRSFAWGMGYFTFGVSWVHVSIEAFGGMPLWASLLLMLLLCSYLALYPMLCAWLSAKLTHNKCSVIALIPFLWLVSEYLRGVVLTGFPWLSIGYSQINGPFASLAPIVGEVGVSFLLMLSCASVVMLFSNQQRKLALSSMFGVALLVVGSQQLSFVTTSNSAFSVALVQGNIEQKLRWDDAAEQKIIDLYVNSSEPLYSQHDIVIWPEAAIPRLEPLAQETLREINANAHQQGSAVITGIINYDPQTRNFFNSIIVLGNKQKAAEQPSYYYGNSNTFNKHHLLPIGEFVPFSDLLRPLAPLFNLPMSSFTAGDYIQQNLQANDIHLLPLICFEIVFPNQLAANLTANTDAILTISNDAWFGDSHGPHQHLQIAQMRALEFGKPVIRATNNGLTAVIDAHGKIVAQIPQFMQTTLSTKVTRSQGTTPYAAYGKQLHKLFIYLLFIAIAIRLIQLRRR